ncbi:hypothetical protein evm_005519 [Chilo suppressalis]|nr:hypothetical protein evm_005519 [Chilo suppressalis]
MAAGCLTWCICVRGILEFFGHIARKKNDTLEVLLVTGKVQGRRPRGRSTMRWKDQIRDNTKIGVHDALHTAEDRNKWKAIVHKIIRGGHDP